MTLNIDDYTISLPDSGKYVIGFDSAEGKTLLGLLLGSVQDSDVSYAYINALSFRILDINALHNFDIIFLDDYDLYSTEQLSKALIELPATKLVLVDSKYADQELPFKWTTIKTTKNRIEVSGW